jgi:hypothetical protein
MAVADIINALRVKRDKLDVAIAALSGHGPIRRRPRRPGAVPVEFKQPRRRRRMSAAARKRIGDATRARWLRAKESGKSTL